MDMRKRLLAQMVPDRKLAIPADVEVKNADRRAMLAPQVGDLEQRIESMDAREKSSPAKPSLLRFIPGIGSASAVMLIAGIPQLDLMTSGDTAAPTGLALIQAKMVR